MHYKNDATSKLKYFKTMKYVLENGIATLCKYESTLFYFYKKTQLISTNLF